MDERDAPQSAAAPWPTLAALVNVPALVNGRVCVNTLSVTAEQNEVLLSITRVLSDMPPAGRERFMRHECTFGVMARLTQDDVTGAYSFRLAIETNVDQLARVKDFAERVQVSHPHLFKASSVEASRNEPQPSPETPLTSGRSPTLLRQIRAFVAALTSRLGRSQ